LLFALGCVTLAMILALLRMLLGPRAQDRVVAYDCLYQCTMLVILLLGLEYRSSSYFEAALLIAVFGFVGSTAMSKFLLRGEVIE
jgi:multicomponent K+:H+ antiporter subunit F